VRAVVTREKGCNDELRAWLPEGTVVDEVPLTTTHYFEVGDVVESLRADSRWGSFAALVASSARCARYVPTVRIALRDGGLLLAVGNATAAALAEENLVVDVVGRGSAVNLAPSLSDGPVLVLGAATPRDELRAAIEARGIEVLSLACYETAPATLRGSDEKRLRTGDVIFIGAPSAWTVARGLVRPDALVVVPGATTAEIVRGSHDNVIEGWGPELKERLAGRWHQRKQRRNPAIG
jgi:uroporphyrinogen-III synthase